MTSQLRPRSHPHPSPHHHHNQLAYFYLLFMLHEASSNLCLLSILKDGTCACLWFFWRNDTNFWGSVGSGVGRHSQAIKCIYSEPNLVLCGSWYLSKYYSIAPKDGFQLQEGLEFNEAGRCMKFNNTMDFWYSPVICQVLKTGWPESGDEVMIQLLLFPMYASPYTESYHLSFP